MTHAPEALQKTQEWFASIITQRMEAECRIRPLTPSGNPIEKEACAWIDPSPTLAPHQRMEIYNQQYWWRVLDALQDTYALTVRLFGYEEFNERIAEPYLTAYPSDSWTLAFMGKRLPRWIDEAYCGPDKALVLHAAKLDWAYNESFYAPVESDPHLEADAFEKKLYLQKHLHLFSFPYDLFYFRKAMLREEVDHWVENPFPKLEKSKPYSGVVYRNRSLNVEDALLSDPEAHLLGRFQNGETIANGCTWVEEQPEALQTEIMTHLQEWFQKWVSKGWLTEETQ